MDSKEAKQDAVATQEWSDADMERLAAFAISMKGKQLSNEDYAKMQEINANHGMYIAALHSQNMVSEISKFYKAGITAALSVNIQIEGLYIEHGICTDPCIIRAWLLHHFHKDRLCLADYDSPDTKKHVIREDIKKEMQVQVTAFEPGAIQVSFINTLDPRPETRQVSYQLKDPQTPKERAVIITNAVVKFALSIILFQQHGRLMRYN